MLCTIELRNKFQLNSLYLEVNLYVFWIQYEPDAKLSSVGCRKAILQ